MCYILSYISILSCVLNFHVLAYFIIRSVLSYATYMFLFSWISNFYFCKHFYYSTFINYCIVIFGVFFFWLQYFCSGAAASASAEEGLQVWRGGQPLGGRETQRPHEPTTGQGHHHQVRLSVVWCFTHKTDSDWNSGLWIRINVLALGINP